jgi:TPR repeat protein
MAYELLRASCSAEEQAVKAKDHLQSAAELGNPVAQALLAGRFRSGTAGFRKDAGLYEYWMSKSIEQGEIDALCSYVERRVMDGSVVSSALRSKVVAAAEQSERAAELLKQLDGR